MNDQRQYTPQVQQWIDEFVAWRDREPSTADRVLDGVKSLRLWVPTHALISTEGYIIPFDRKISMTDIEAILEAESLTTVPLLDRVHVMVVDDDGVKKGLPVNELATQHYYLKCGGVVDWVIRGDVVIVPDSDYEDPSNKGMW